MTSPLPIRLQDADLAVATHGLHKRYRRKTALHDVTLQIPDGAVYLLVGPNGAGKSTTLKILLDLVRPDTGTASILGLDTRHQGAQARANIGYVPERSDWGYSWMHVGHLLQCHARYFPNWDPAYANRLATAFDVDQSQRMDKLSKGQGRRIHLIMALAHRPPLLLLDEPTDGLDPIMRDQLLGIVSDHLAETPTTVLISTHHVEEVERIADHIGVLHEGRLTAQMSFDALRMHLRRYRVEVPERWQGVPALNGAVLHRVDTPREVQWTIWGTEADIRQHFTNAHGTVREVTPLSLLDSTLTFLHAKR